MSEVARLRRLLAEAEAAREAALNHHGEVYRQLVNAKDELRRALTTINRLETEADPDWRRAFYAKADARIAAIAAERDEARREVEQLRARLAKNCGRGRNCSVGETPCLECGGEHCAESEPCATCVRDGVFSFARH